MHYLLFTTTTCAKCPTMKAEVAKYDASGKVLDENDTEFIEQAKSLGISSVPVLVTFDDQDQEIARTDEASEVAKLLSV